MKARESARARLSMRALITTVATTATLALAFAISPTLAQAGTANAGISGAPASNPLAGLKWGVYTKTQWARGTLNGLWDSYNAASGNDRTLLGMEALQPLAYWFGNWNPASTLTSYMRDYIKDVTHDNKNVMAQITDFRLNPWEGQACTALSASQIAGYKTWTNDLAAAIGDWRVALILQPDLPEADPCSEPSRSDAIDEVAYAAKKLGSLKHTTVYIDAGAADWSEVSIVSGLLRKAGVRYARGFSLDATHYSTTSSNISYGTEIVKRLAKDGLKNKHFVIDTTENGRGFTHQWYVAHYGSAAGYGTAPVCASVKSSDCVTLGIPPTTNVAAAEWHLPGWADADARKYVDAYLWFARPWIDQAVEKPLDTPRALQLARSTPYAAAIKANENS